MKQGEKNIYRILYTGFADGTHEFNYHLSEAFFQKVENSSIKDADLNVKISIKKDSERLMEISFAIRGSIKLQCDRCLDYFKHPVYIDELLFVKLGKKYFEEAENVIVWPDNDPYINLAPPIYDYVELSLPYQKVHPFDDEGNPTCNKEMIENLNKYLLQSEDKNKIDPRWNQLNNLLN